MQTTTAATDLAAEHDNFAMFTDAGGRAVATIVLQLQRRGITHRRGEALHADAQGALDRLSAFHAEATDTAVREAIAHAIAEPEAELPHANRRDAIAWLANAADAIGHAADLVAGDAELERLAAAAEHARVAFRNALQARA